MLAITKTEQKLKEKTRKYKTLTSKALAKIRLAKGISGKERAIALDFLKMAQDYFSDAKHFQKKGDWLNALAAFSYAHAWLDAGVRAKILDGKGDSKLFVLP